MGAAHPTRGIIETNTDMKKANMTQTEVNPPPTIGRASVEAQDLAKLLEKAEVGQVFTYSEMNDAAKADVQQRNTILQTARRMSMRSKRIVFGTLHGVGIKRLDDDEIPDEAASHVKRARRIARKGTTKLECADLTKMRPEMKVKTITTRTILGLFAASGSRHVLNLTEQAVRSSPDSPKIGDISSLFAKK